MTSTLLVTFLLLFFFNWPKSVLVIGQEHGIAISLVAISRDAPDIEKLSGIRPDSSYYPTG